MEPDTARGVDTHGDDILVLLRIGWVRISLEESLVHHDSSIHYGGRLLPYLGHRLPTEGCDSGSTAKPDEPGGLSPRAVADPRSTAMVRLLWELA